MGIWRYLGFMMDGLLMLGGKVVGSRGFIRKVLSWRRIGEEVFWFFLERKREFMWVLELGMLEDRLLIYFFILGVSFIR